MAFDNTGFEEVRAQGAGNLSRAPVLVPIVVTARRVTGVGDVAEGILANLRLQGVLRVTAQRLVGENLVLTSDKLRGLVDLGVDLKTGVYAVILNGGMRTYVIPGFGVVDVLAELRAVPGPERRGTMVTGTARAWVRRHGQPLPRLGVGRAADAFDQPDPRAGPDRPFLESQDRRARHRARRGRLPAHRRHLLARSGRAA